MDLKNPLLMYVKAGMFLLIGVVCFAMAMLDYPTVRNAALLVVMIWAFARAYYFAFYVVEKYADPAYRFSGLLFVRQVPAEEMVAQTSRQWPNMKASVHVPLNRDGTKAPLARLEAHG